MAKELKCADVGFDCQAVINADTEDEVMAQAADHAKSAHGMSDSDLQQNEPAIRAAIFSILLGFFAFMVWVGLRYAAFAWAQTTPVMQIPIGAVYLAMPIGFVLAIFHLLMMAAPYVHRRALLADGEFDADVAKLPSG